MFVRKLKKKFVMSNKYATQYKLLSLFFAKFFFTFLLLTNENYNNID